MTGRRTVVYLKPSVVSANRRLRCSSCGKKRRALIAVRLSVGDREWCKECTVQYNRAAMKRDRSVPFMSTRLYGKYCAHFQFQARQSPYRSDPYRPSEA